MKRRERRRVNTEKVIKKRLRILKDCWGYGRHGSRYKLREQKNPGRLKKFNFTCDCGHKKWDQIYAERRRKQKENNEFPKDWRSEYY